jgi:hypothetical protein
MAIRAKEAYRSDVSVTTLLALPLHARGVRLLGHRRRAPGALGLNLGGPATAAIVSTIEPVVTVVLAMAFFDERLGPVQSLGRHPRAHRRDPLGG